MFFIRNFKNAIFNWYQKIKYFNIINKCNYITNNHLRNSKNYLHQNGFKISKDKISLELLNKFKMFFDNKKNFHTRNYRFI